MRKCVGISTKFLSHLLCEHKFGDRLIWSIIIIIIIIKGGVLIVAQPMPRKRCVCSTLSSFARRVKWRRASSIVRSFLRLLRCPAGRFVNTGRGRVERRRRDLGLRRCDRVAVERKFNADWSAAKMSNLRPESFYISTKCEFCATLLLPNFQISSTQLLYMWWSDVTESVVTIRSPFFWL